MSIIHIKNNIQVEYDKGIVFITALEGRERKKIRGGFDINEGHYLGAKGTPVKNCPRAVAVTSSEIYGSLFRQLSQIDNREEQIAFLQAEPVDDRLPLFIMFKRLQNEAKDRALYGMDIIEKWAKLGFPSYSPRSISSSKSRKLEAEKIKTVRDFILTREDNYINLIVGFPRVDMQDFEMYCRAYERERKLANEFKNKTVLSLDTSRLERIMEHKGTKGYRNFRKALVDSLNRYFTQEQLSDDRKRESNIAIRYMMNVYLEMVEQIFNSGVEYKFNSSRNYLIDSIREMQSFIDSHEDEITREKYVQKHEGFEWLERYYGEEDFQFSLPKGKQELIDVGNKMSNCIGSIMSDDYHNNDNILIIGYKGDRPKYGILLRKHYDNQYYITSALAERNTSIPRDCPIWADYKRFLENNSIKIN